MRSTPFAKRSAPTLPAVALRNVSMPPSRQRRKTLFCRAIVAFAACMPLPAMAAPTLLRPAQVFDGVDATAHPGWQVLVDGDRIVAVGTNLPVPAGAKVIDLPRATLLAGFTTERDLGTEGAGFADVGLRDAIAQAIVPGPRMLVATRAIVARGAYGPKGFEPGVPRPQGAEEVSGIDEIVRAVRGQIAAGADV
eukprot:gene10865-13914_t